MNGTHFWLNDAAWSLIEPMLPKNQPHPRRVDDRRVLSGFFDVLRSGCRWPDCPPEYDPRTTIYNRSNRLRDLLAASPSEIGSDDLLTIDGAQQKRRRTRRSASRAAGAPQRSISPSTFSAGRSPAT